MLREFGTMLAPRVVFWIYTDRVDLEQPLTDALATPTLVAYLDPGHSQDLLRHEGELSRQLSDLVAVRTGQQEATIEQQWPASRMTWRSIARLERVRARLGLTGSPVPSGRLDLWERIVADAQRTAASAGGHLVVVYLPTATTLRTGRDDPFKVGVEATLARRHAPLLDMTPVLRRSPSPLDYVRMTNGLLDNHYNDRGHHLIAHCLNSYLDRALAAPNLRPTCESP
jgi:hypothetical protein